MSGLWILVNFPQYFGYFGMFWDILPRSRGLVLAFFLLASAGLSWTRLFRMGSWKIFFKPDSYFQAQKENSGECVIKAGGRTIKGSPPRQKSGFLLVWYSYSLTMIYFHPIFFWDPKIVQHLWQRTQLLLLQVGSGADFLDVKEAKLGPNGEPWTQRWSVSPRHSNDGNWIGVRICNPQELGVTFRLVNSKLIVISYGTWYINVHNIYF